MTRGKYVPHRLASADDTAPVDPRATRSKAFRGAYRKGHAAGLEGAPETACPYKIAPNGFTNALAGARQLRRYWLAGWRDGVHEKIGHKIADALTVESARATLAVMGGAQEEHLPIGPNSHRVGDVVELRTGLGGLVRYRITRIDNHFLAVYGVREEA